MYVPLEQITNAKTETHTDAIRVKPNSQIT